jgi:hypothetical protein
MCHVLQDTSNGAPARDPARRIVQGSFEMVLTMPGVSRLNAGILITLRQS